ncbi:hypothetical protein J2752_002033 [Halarchaeum rubridurum]|uniref:Uncharacterized protein n=1 Tax=Halarchaeum rubridurum TaxID=489911 RepID=A0A8T4GR13_9EURY|nr:hypothetical protein [Halarchaeum rubridurum]MBP1955121.1 hypothetical protein [Halarchaeum rubridurum]
MPEKERPSQDRQSSSESEETPPAETVEEAALETVRQESRTVLSEQVSLLNDIDDKAMRTVRTAVLLLGLVISAIKLSDQPVAPSEIGPLVFSIGSSGIALLLLAVLLGSITYSYSKPELGVSKDHRRDVVRGGYSNKEWLRLQLNEYDEWIDDMSETNSINAFLLTVTQISLITGIGSLLLAFVKSAKISSSALEMPIIVSGVGLGVTAVVLWLAKRN